MNSTVVVDRSAINERAYLRWLQRGCPDGSPDYDWFEAEQEFLRGHVAPAVDNPAVDTVEPAPSVEVTPAVSTASADKQKSASKRSRGRRGPVETSVAPAAAPAASAAASGTGAAGTGAASSAGTRRRGPASSTKPVAGSTKRRAAG